MNGSRSRRGVLWGLGSILAVSCATSASWDWERWSRALIDGVDPAELPPIPSEGWEQGREQGNEHSWFRDGAQIGDFNGDGKIDYVRIQDPPGSYNHLIWVDLDHDGYFDSRGGENRNPQRSGQRVPEFAR